MDETKYNKIIIKSNTKLANIITWFMFRLQFIIYISPFYRNSMKRKYVEWKTHQVWADIFSNVAITIISLAALIHPWPTVHHLHSRQPESCFDGSHNFLSFSPPLPPQPKTGGLSERLWRLLLWSGPNQQLGACTRCPGRRGVQMVPSEPPWKGQSHTAG